MIGLPGLAIAAIVIAAPLSTPVAQICSVMNGERICAEGKAAPRPLAVAPPASAPVVVAPPAPPVRSVPVSPAIAPAAPVVAPVARVAPPRAKAAPVRAKPVVRRPSRAEKAARRAVHVGRGRGYVRRYYDEEDYEPYRPRRYWRRYREDYDPCRRRNLCND